MRITRLEVCDFRNYERFTVEPGPALTVLVGPNAAGKTNLVEALRLLTATVPLRPGRSEELVRWGAESCSISLAAEEDERRLEIEMVVTSEARKSWRVNGKPRRGASDVVGMLPSVAFTPGDLDMVKGPSERRRAAIDDLGCQMSPVYASLRRDYSRAVRQRNALLKEDASAAELAPWDSQVASLGGRLLSHRLRLLDRIMVKATAGYAALAGGESLGWVYADRSGLEGAGAPDADPGTVAQALEREMVRRSHEERRRGVGLVGPHRDDIVFDIGGKDARTYASQGQQRTVALAWKLAEVDVVAEVLRRKPVLLLDDVMSELDETRRAALAERVTAEVQTVITTTNIGYFSESLLSGAHVVELGT